MEPFTHLLLTRFNTRSSQNSSKGCDHEWLDYRFQLFDRFCFPSVCNQSNQNFKWLVFFDANTPDEYKQKIESYTRYNNFFPIYLDFVLPYDNFPDELREILRSHIGQSEYLITTWLDNDDAICQEYIQTIQNNFEYQESESINFISGYQLYQGKLYREFEIASHFLSLIERYNPETFNTVFARDHNFLFEVCHSARNILCKPAWLEVVHGNNVMNVYRKGIRVPIKSSLERFSIELDEAIIEKDKERVTFLVEQIKIAVRFPYAFARKIYFYIKHPRFSFFTVFRDFRFQSYPEKLIILWKFCT